MTKAQTTYGDVDADVEDVDVWRCVEMCGNVGEVGCGHAEGHAGRRERRSRGVWGDARGQV